MTESGRCQCGKVHYTLEGDPLMTYACHCRDCQQRTGSAFSEGTLVLADQLRIEGELTAWQRTSDTGASKTRHSCAACGNIIYGTADNMPGILLLQSGTLDNAAAIHPEAHLWMQSAQSWITLPQGVPHWDTQPDDMTEVLEAATAYRLS